MLRLRDQLKDLYAEYSIYILPVIKYALALFTFISINRMLGYLEPLNQVALVLILSAVCALLPWNTIPVLGVLLVILHCFGLGPEVGACAAALYMILLIFYFRFVPGDGLALTLTAATCSVGVPGVVPLGLGLMRGPVSALTAAGSMISWFFILTVKEIAEPLKYSPDSSMLDVVQAMLAGMVDNRRMLVYVVTFAAVVLSVSLIRSSGISRSWELAIAAGAVLQAGLFLVLSQMLAVETDTAAFLAGTVIAAAISCVLAFFVYNVDYKGAEHYQFEDDDYVYYVKAIPKKTSGFSEEDQEQPNEN